MHFHMCYAYEDFERQRKSLFKAIILGHFQKRLTALFSKVFKIFKILSKAVCFCRSVQATWLLYHKFSHLSTVNSNFLKIILFFSISEAIPCDSLFTIPLSQGIVKHFLQKSLYFFVQIICRIMSNSFSCILARHELYYNKAFHFSKSI